MSLCNLNSCGDHTETHWWGSVCFQNSSDPGVKQMSVTLCLVKMFKWAESIWKTTMVCRCRVFSGTHVHSLGLTLRSYVLCKPGIDFPTSSVIYMKKINLWIDYLLNSNLIKYIFTNNIKVKCRHLSQLWRRVGGGLSWDYFVTCKRCTS